MILYGWNNYVLKTVEPHELGISQNAGSNVQIQYRQKYFHLFFIPVFPIGKFWAIKQAGQLYQPSAEMQQALVGIDVKTKNKIWAWTGLLLIGAVLLFYNVSEKLEASNNAKRREAHSSMLMSFFKDPKNTQEPASKMRTINYLIDSSINDESYENKKIDTTTSGLLRLLLDIKSTQLDTISGYTENNTVVFSCIDHKKNKGDLPGDEIKKALSEGTWSGYGDTGSVYHSLRKLGEYRYLLVLKEYNRMSPEIQSSNFNSGISLVNAYVFDLQDKNMVHKFKVFGTNSDSVSHMTWGRKGERQSVSQSQWRDVLESDLNRNTIKKAYEYIFQDKSRVIFADKSSAKL